jgi:HSP20 family protein
MSKVAIEKVNDATKSELPVFEAIANEFEAIRRRAFDLFERRGCVHGFDLEDWLRAEHEQTGWPASELAEKDGVYDAQITLPGFEPKDIEVTATPSELIVHAATKEEKKTETKNVLWTEFGSNDVYRHFGLSKPIDVDKVTADLNNGILKITAPQTAAAPKAAAAKA